MPTLTLQSGQKIKVPDGLSPEQMDEVVQHASQEAAAPESSMTSRIKDAVLDVRNLPPGIQQAVGLGMDTKAILKNPIEALQAGASKLRQSATLGLAPYAEAGLKTLLPSSGSYSDNLLSTFDQLRSQQEQFPGVTAASSVLGSLINPAYQAVKGPVGLTTLNVAGGQAQMDPRSSILDRAKQAGLDAASSLAGYGTSRYLSSQAEKPYISTARGEVLNPKQQIESQTGIKIPVATDDATESAIKDTVGYVVRKSPLTSGLMKRFGLSQEEALAQVGDRLEQSAGLPGRVVTTGPTGLQQKTLTPIVDDSRVVASIVNKTEQQWKAFQGQATQRYQAIADSADDQFIRPPNVLKYLQDNQDLLRSEAVQKLKPSASSALSILKEKFDTPQVGKGIDPTYGVVDKSLRSTSPSSGTFKDLQDLRQLVSEVEYGLGRGPDKTAIVKLKAAIDKDFEIMADQMAVSGNGKAAQILRDTNKWYRDQSNRFKINVLEKVEDIAGEVTPFTSKGAQALTRSIKNGDVEALRKIKSLVGDEDFKPLQDQFRQWLLRGKSDQYDFVGGSPKNPDGNPLKMRINGLVNKKVLVEMLGEKDANLVKALADIAPHLQDAANAHVRTPLNISNLAATGAGVGAMAWAAKSLGVATPAAAAIPPAITANYVAAKLFTDPRAQNFMLRNWRPGMNSKALFILSSKLFSEFEAVDKPAPKVNIAE